MHMHCPECSHFLSGRICSTGKATSNTLLDSEFSIIYSDLHHHPISHSEMNNKREPIENDFRIPDSDFNMNSFMLLVRVLEPPTQLNAGSVGLFSPTTSNGLLRHSGAKFSQLALRWQQNYINSDSMQWWITTSCRLQVVHTQVSRHILYICQPEYTAYMNWK